MIYKYKTKARSLKKDFSNYQNPIDLFINLRDGNANPRAVLKSQIYFKSDLGKMKINCKTKCSNFSWLKRKIKNFFRNYYILLSEAKYKAKHGKGLKILTPKQMLQRLPIALAQVKAGNTSESLLNEIRQILYSLYQAKKILKMYIIIYWIQ